MSQQKRRKFTSSQKAEILRRHLKDKVPVSHLCEEYQLQPSVLHDWLGKALAHLDAALDVPTPRKVHREEQQPHYTGPNRPGQLSHVSAEPVRGTIGGVLVTADAAAASWSVTAPRHHEHIDHTLRPMF